MPIYRVYTSNGYREPASHNLQAVDLVALVVHAQCKSIQGLKESKLSSKRYLLGLQTRVAYTHPRSVKAHGIII